ncbi:MAG: phosphoribosylformylglycinamidine cyclo-ligase [Candidatus Marinimicrobia bacterium]|nr:phosphoribosylformylglycinamidine cyclo-ligase [Candidatus Neomarinimicrobiota bacterium]MCF7828256.1 phosphoribosylformylglycinamidine cyclo-ligase [Candidatus Neomarinimicrobiota bacterium]MCF7879569.1 phosphoribosylformylglycinamidine cyclo-ligase [Candidatus Neomarinimicrobiota bacterium]
MGISYKDAGVDIDAGESAVKNIKEMVRETYNDNVLSDVGQFGGFYAFPKDNYTNPVLVSSTDGVGTKLKVAFKTGIHSTIGQDLVNHCVNDILTSGAVPMFFLDYIGIGKMEEQVVSEVVSGFAKACKENSCVLIGGEMAEMAGFYTPGEYDVAGTIVGVVERDHIINGGNISEGDVVVGLQSTGLHTNGYTLARKVLLEEFDVDTYRDELGETIGEALLRVHKSYQNEIRPLIGDSRLKGIAHITGGGLLGNSSRIIPDGLSLSVDWDAWELPPLFRLIKETGDISDHEMRRTFNCGIGLVTVVPAEEADFFMEHFEKYQSQPVVIGEIGKSE